MIQMLRPISVRRWLANSLAALSLVVTTAQFSPFRAFASGPVQNTMEITVDENSGADTNPGTSDRPVKTIGQAAQMAMSNGRHDTSTIVTIRPGTYREYVRITNAGPSMRASIRFQASQAGTAILSGSDLWTDWQPDPANPRVYLHPWKYRWGDCEPPRGWPMIKELGLRREMIFVDAAPMTQVLSRNELKEGSFFVDEASGVVSLWPRAATNMNGAKIEVAVRPAIFE
ncbi:MAG: hypothetical protein WCD40_09605, partial [Candidatus Acidiferrales bacterium]